MNIENTYSILRATEAGLMEYWKRQSTMNIDKCRQENRKTDETMKPIQLVEFSSVFFVFGLGVGLASITFVLEYLLNHFTLSKKQW